MSDMLKIVRQNKKLNENQMILESQESKSIAATKKLWHECNMKEDKFETYLNQLRSAVPVLKTKEGAKYILGCTRMGLNHQFNSARDFTVANNILKIIVSAHNEEYDRNLNDMSFLLLKRKFGKEIQFNLDKQKEMLAKMQFSGKSDYEIVKINSFEESKAYHEYTDWCITYREDMWSIYTLDGTNAFYFLLKKGYQNVQKEKGENCPLDEYGLSMIAVSVCPDGSINSSTCRWNHDNGGTDAMFDYVQISKLIQRNFFDVFKPNLEEKKENYFDTFVREYLIGKDINEIDTNLLEKQNASLNYMGHDFILVVNGYLNIVYIKEHKFSGVVFPTWIKHKTAADLVAFGKRTYGYMNNDREFSVYSVKNDETVEKVFGPIECIGFTRSGICINSDSTLTIYDKDFLENANCKKWTTTWKLNISQIRKIAFMSVTSPVVTYKDGRPNIISIEFYMTKSESESVPERYGKKYRKFYDFKTGFDLIPGCKILSLYVAKYRGDNEYEIGYLDKDGVYRQDFSKLERNEDGTLKIGINENVNMKTMTQLCESIMDDLDIQPEVTASQTIVKNVKMTDREIEDYPYMFMFIMWDKHYLYRDRQKIKKDVEAFLGQFRPITEYSPIVFDKDPGDTTYSFGFEHNMRTVTQFYRMFTGIISYMHNYITTVSEYEFIVKDLAKDEELCRMNKDDVVLFTNILKNHSLGNDKDEAGNQMGYLQETCVDLLGLSWEEVANQMSRLFNVNFKYYDKYDDDDNAFVIDKVFLNESKQKKSMSELCESIMDDLSKENIPASEKLVRTIQTRKKKIRDSVKKLLETIRDVNKMIDKIKGMNKTDKDCFKLDVKLFSPYDSETGEFEEIFGESILKKPEIFDEVCEKIYQVYNEKINSEYQWWFDSSSNKEDLYNKFENFVERWHRRFGDDKRNEILLLGEYDMNCVTFLNMSPVKLLEEMQKWADKHFRMFIMTKLDPDSIYYDD